MNFEELKAHIENLDTKVNELSFKRKENFTNQLSLEKEISNLEESVELTQKVSSLFKHLLDVLLDEKKKDIEQLVNYGLKTVIDDRDLRFHIDIEPKYSSIHTTFKTEEVGVSEGDVLKNFGGGVVNIESFLLRIITLFQTNLSPYLFLDESFSHLSEEYIENCSLLLNNLCKKLGLTVLLITHKDLMLSYADKVYKGKSRYNKLHLDEIKK
jgi:DNA repair exonuclease SbcCD ATPase subunit